MHQQPSNEQCSLPFVLSPVEELEALTEIVLAAGFDAGPQFSERLTQIRATYEPIGMGPQLDGTGIVLVAPESQPDRGDAEGLNFE